MSLDRLERRLPEVLTELSLPRVPDYVDDLLGRTERMPQRPGWTFPERWIPLNAIADTLPAGRRLTLRPLIVVAILVALALVAVVLIVGSQKRLPPLFGPAGNGLIVSANAAGDIVALDPSTNAERTLVVGPNLCCVDVSPDGQRISYLRIPPSNPNGDPTSAVIAKMDGSTIREIPGNLLVGLTWGEWSRSGDQHLLITKAGPIIVDLKDGSVTSIDVPFEVEGATWIGATGDILLTSKIADTPAEYVTPSVYRLRAGETSNPTKVSDIEYAVDPPEVSPDGSKFLYFVWGPEVRLQGRVHVFDFATGIDTTVTPDDEASNAVLHEVEDPHWSPGGSLIAAQWFFADYDQIGITPAGGGETRFLEPKAEQGFHGGYRMTFSPDGKSLLVRYGTDDLTWLLPVDGSPGRQVTWTFGEEWTWQRVAP